MNILLSGGGTLGSVTPLLALVDELRARNENEFLWLGTRHGPEQPLVEEWNVPFRSILAGKLRRYFSWRNFLGPFFILIGFVQALYFLKKFKAERVLTAGSFAAVPVAWAAWVLRIPVLVHQQDFTWGLANKLMAPAAYWITLNFESLLEHLPKRFHKKTRVTGNPVRRQIYDLLNQPKDKNLLFTKFNLEPEVPVVLVAGGGTGALRLNQIVAEAMPYLYTHCQVLHLTGKEKKVDLSEGEWGKRYHWQAFLIKEMPDVYSVADLVISRAGLGTMTELTVLGKPAIIVAMPHSHQEANAKYLADHQAAVVLDQEQMTPQLLAEVVNKLLANPEKLAILVANIRKLANLNAAKEIVELVTNA